MKQRLSVALLFISISVLLYQCTGCENGKQIKSVENTPAKEDTLGFEDKNRPEWDQIEASLRAHLDAQANEDFETYLDYVNPKMFITNSRESIIQGFQDWSDKGLHNRTENVEITRISPIVSDDTSDYAVLWFNGDMIVDFDSTFAGDPKGFMMQLEDQHGKGNVSYDSTKRDFIVDRVFKMYAQRVGDSPKWFFLNEAFYGGASGNGNLMSKDVLMELKTYE